MSSNKKQQLNKNLLDFEEIHLNSSESPYSSNLSYEDHKTNNTGIINYILITLTNWHYHTMLFWSYIILFTNAFFWSETLQSSSIIASSSHNDNTVSTFGCDLIIMWLVVYFLLNQQKIYLHNKPDELLYWIFLHLGAIGFALLGEVPFLKNIVIVNNFWKHLNPSAWLVIFFIGGTIIGIGIKELIDSCKDKKFKFSLFNIALVASGYSYMLFILKIGNAKAIHYHVHHAIFAGVLSLWFTDWNNWFEMSMNAILMGVVVEGINFYGVGELFLFLTDGHVEMSFYNSMTISLLYTVLILLLFAFSYSINLYKN
jgi:hypothetical protein